MKQSARIVSWIVTAPIVLVVVLFAVSNLDEVTIHLKPLPFDLMIPIWALTLIVLFVGFLLGAIVTWIGDRKRRRDARLLGRRVAALEQSLTAAQGQIAELERKLRDQRVSLPEVSAA
jgi:putative membrane protein